MQAEAVAVHVLSPGRFVGEQLSVEGTLREALPYDWHCGAIGFQKIVCQSMGCAASSRRKSAAPLLPIP